MINIDKPWELLAPYGPHIMKSSRFDTTSGQTQPTVAENNKEIRVQKYSDIPEFPSNHY